MLSLHKQAVCNLILNIIAFFSAPYGRLPLLQPPFCCVAISLRLFLACVALLCKYTKVARVCVSIFHNLCFVFYDVWCARCDAHIDLSRGGI